MMLPTVKITSPAGVGVGILDAESTTIPGIMYAKVPGIAIKSQKRT